MKQQLQVTLRIREMILQGELAPGQRVPEATIAQQLGISRTPVRQALPALAGEGLLVPAGRRGYAVRVFTINEIVTALDIRAALEGMAARLLTERGVPHVLIRSLKSCLNEGDALFAKRRIEKGDEISYGEMNRKFHDAILAAVDNSIISGLVARLQHVPFVSPATIAFDRKSAEDMYDLLFHAHRQHRAITEALENSEGARVESLLREHVYAQKESMNLIGHRPGMQQSAITGHPTQAGLVQGRA